MIKVMKENITSIIPTRAGSVRIKNKNTQNIGEFSLLERKIRQLETSSYINNIIVGTNCPISLEIAQKRNTKILNRDDFHCDERVASANDMIADLASRAEGDIIVWCHCTNPFLYARHYDAAIKEFLEAEKNGFDSLLSVQKIQSHMWDENQTPVNYNPYTLKHTLAKDLSPVYFQDGGIFIQRRVNMVKNSYFFGGKPKIFEIETPFTLDINTQIDLEIARAIAPWIDKKENF